MFIKFGNKRASFDNGNLSVGYSQATLPEDPVVIYPPLIESNGFRTDDFNDIGDVYDALYPEDKLILILRHGHRTKDTISDGITNEERLTNLGKAQCRLVGSKLKFNDTFPKNDSKYLSSDTDRTRNSCYNIMLGREDTLYNDKTEIRNDCTYNPVTEFEFQALENKEYNVLRDEDFKYLPGFTAKDNTGDGWGKVSNYSFGLHQTADANTLLVRKNEKDELSNIILNKLIAESDKKINIYSSHDYKLTPILSTFTDVQYDFQAGESGFDISDNRWKNGRWINYLSGLACVIHINGAKEYIPVRGLSNGYSYDYLDSHDENWTGPDDPTLEWAPFLP